MGLSLALDSALSGLRQTQVGLDTVSRNIANAGVDGYARRRVGSVERFPAGVRDAQVQRALDLIVQRQLRTEAAGGAYTTAAASALQRLDAAMGVPGSAGALDTRFNAFVTSLQSLANEPANLSARRTVLSEAQQLAAGLNRLSGDVQEIRGDAESRIAAAVGEANAALQSIERISLQLHSSVTGNARADLEDELDRQIGRLSALIDIRVGDDGEGSVSIFTTTGIALFAGKASRLDFDGRGAAHSTARYDPNPAKSGLGRLQVIDPYGKGIDVTNGGVRSGEIGGLLYLRDHELVEAQDRLDAIAAGLARALSDRSVAGTTVTSGASAGFEVDLSGLQPGNAVSLEALQQPGNVPLRYTIVRVDDPAAVPLPADATPDPDDIVIAVNLAGGMAGAVTAIQTALGSGFAVSNPSGSVLRILDDGAAGTRDVTALSAVVTTTALVGQGTELPLFIDAGGGVAARAFSGSFDGGRQGIGFAARIALNPQLGADPTRLVVSSLSPATLAGDPARPLLLHQRLASVDRTFDGTLLNGYPGAVRTSVGDFLRQSLDAQAARALEATRLDEGQQVVVASLQERFAEASGVSIDAEMAELVALQNAYSANARIVSAVREMLETLMRV